MKDSNSAIRFLDNVAANMKKARLVTLMGVILCGVAICGAFAFAYMFTLSQKEQIYVLDQGAVLSAFKADNGVQKDLEVIDHMTRFHELFFNLSPNLEMINTNTSRALELADKSAYNFKRDLEEKQYYQNLIGINAIQQIRVDSVKFDIQNYPYRARTYASLFIMRESNISQYSYRTYCELVDVERSLNNPHGLLIQKFREESNELVGTRRRK